MCNSRNSKKMVVNNKTIRVDKCLEFLIPIYNNARLKTLGCCCGHGKYPLTIIVQNNSNLIFELVSGIIIPRQKRFYVKDEDGLYYVPEVVVKKRHHIEKNKEGRFKCNTTGYIFVAQPKHPFANANGYVREHRLVLEGYLRISHTDHRLKTVACS